MELILTPLVILVLLVASAFFSGSETALTAASRAQMHQLAQKGDRRAAVVTELGRIRERLIGTILLGNNLVNILASALATSFFLTLFGQAGVVYATLIMTALVVIFAEVLPKTYAIANADRMALVVAPILRPLVHVFAPISASIEFLVRQVLKPFGASLEADTPVLSAHEELRGVIDLHHQEGGVIKHDRDMLDGVLDLRELTVSEIMVHRTKMISLNADEPPAKIAERVLKSTKTRLPLWRGQPENIIGVLHAKDLWRAYAEAGGKIDDLDIVSLASEPWFVPEHTSVKDQLNAFLRRKNHFALVVDEYGEVMGLVTLEDILEEIVGEIADEHDVVAEGIRPQPNGAVNVDGSVPIRDLNRHLDWNLPEDVATTIAGLLIHEAQTIPEPGQAFTFYGHRFEVLRKQKNRITALRITPLA